VLRVISLFVLEGAGNPAGPSGREEIAEFYTVNRTAILIVATLHVFGGFFFPGSWPRCAPSSMPAARRRGLPPQGSASKIQVGGKHDHGEPGGVG
jgi:hypothetical protein